LTAVAPGYLAPELSAKLHLMADAEGQGPATIYRFSATSIRRALDAGNDAEGLLAFLRRHSATAVPQPLEYLITDTASRHGRLRVASSASFIQSDDENALTELLGEAGAGGLGLIRLAPAVLASSAGPRGAARVLRELGLSPSVEEAEASAIRVRRSTAVAGSRPVYTAPRTAPPPDAVETQLAVLRQHRGSGTGAVAANGEAATQVGLETLQAAIRLKQAFIRNVVDSQGNANVEAVVPVSVSGGRVRVYDPARETERALSPHRIIHLAPAG